MTKKRGNFQDRFGLLSLTAGHTRCAPWDGTDPMAFTRTIHSSALYYRSKGYMKDFIYTVKVKEGVLIGLKKGHTNE